MLGRLDTTDCHCTEEVVPMQFNLTSYDTSTPAKYTDPILS